MSSSNEDIVPQNVLRIVELHLAPFLDAADLLNLAATATSQRPFAEHLITMNASAAVLAPNHNYKWKHFPVLVNRWNAPPIFRRFFSHNGTLYPFGSKPYLLGTIRDSEYQIPGRTDLLRQVEPKCIRSYRSVGLGLGVYFSQCRCFQAISGCLSGEIFGTRISFPQVTCCDLSTTTLTFFGLQRELIPAEQAQELQVKFVSRNRRCPEAKLPEGMITTWRCASRPGSSLPIESTLDGQMLSYIFVMAAETHLLCAYYKKRRYCGEPAIFGREGDMFKRRCESCVLLPQEEEEEPRPFVPRRWLTEEDSVIQQRAFPTCLMCSYIAPRGPNQGLCCGRLMNVHPDIENIWNRCPEHPVWH
jgi:hypothetical protein